MLVPAAEVASIMALRLHANIEAATEGDAVWLRGQTLDDTTAAALAGLPATERYSWATDDALRPPGALLAVRRLPALAWQDLRAWTRVGFPIAAVPAALPAPARVELVPLHAARQANALLIETTALLEWMEHAPELRLAPLRYAVSGTGRALVLGAPLPPLHGRAAIAIDGIVVPSGYGLRPNVSAAVVRQILNAPDSAVVWWDETGPRVLSSESFVTASRGSARLTRAAITP